MLFKMMCFELRYFIRQPSFYVTSLVLFLLTFFASVSDAVQIGGGGNVNINSPYTILQTISIMTIFSIFLVVNFVGSAVIRDDQSKFSELILSKPLHLAQYRLGRFLGAYLVTLFVFSMCLVGIWVGSSIGGLVGWLDEELIGPNKLSYYLTPLFIIAAPSLFFMASLFALVAQKFRTMIAMYLVAVGLFVTYLVANSIFSDIEYRTIAAYLDMFGLSAISAQSEYWTIADRNTLVIKLVDELLYNRLIWVSIALISLFALTLKTSHYLPQKQKTKSKAKGTGSQATALQNRFDYKAGAGSSWAHLCTRTAFEVKQVIKSYPFLVLLILAVATLIPGLVGSFNWYGTEVWPVTFQMVELIRGSFWQLLLIVLVYYSAEIVWHDRESRMGDIIDSYPVANWVFWVSKYIALVAVMLLLCVFGSLITISYQLLSGVTQIDIAQYIVRLGYLFVLGFAFQTTLAFLIQVISPSKYMGMGLFVVYAIISIVLSNFGFEHRMYHLGDTPSVPYSDINGYGHFLTAAHWYNLYWLGFSMILATLSYALWPRGAGQNLKSRITQINYQLGKTGKALLACGALIFIGSGSHIYYNTRVVNEFISQDETEDIAEQYELQFAQFRDDPVPVTLDVQLDAEIFPKTRRIEAKVKLLVENRSDTEITRLLVNKPSHTLEWHVEMAGATLGKEDKMFNHAWLEFSQPMVPGEQRELTMSVVRQTLGFVDRGNDVTLVNNGTFIDNSTLFPTFGYSIYKQIQDKSERRQRGLEPLKRGNKIEEAQYHHEPLFAENFVTFSATVTTDESQVAMVPGYLQSKQTKRGRTTYVYEMDAPMLHFYNILSMDLEVRREQYKGITLEVYYHEDHAWNVDTMLQSIKDSIDYFTREFGPYQHKQMRIVEFPRYRDFAQSFANTVPYSENIGFLTDTRNSDNINVPYYVTSHELAHQWWAHQVIGANVEGSNILSEMLSQYSAIMVMKEKYGEHNLRKFLKYELDSYLRGRGSDPYEERALARTVGQQYIHYNKGSVVMLALHDLLGEQRLNRALREFLDDYRFRTDVFPTTLDFLTYLKDGASEQEQVFIEDQFNAITLYELKLADVEVQEAVQEGELHTMTLTVNAAKKHADGEGNEEEIPLNQEIDIALFSADPNTIQSDETLLYLQKHVITSGENKIELKVKELPKFAGVDPFVKLIDKKTADNIKSL
ncbi:MULTISPECIES: ABC transporter permease/M1 family aminopeptidase [unclassified Pseudoalteromonas]|uniref:ABC transporter permease/M1 family aminopeptidase n=1 Tax=unclassified Pseudoalteromonas TaxID=194690 RepID=UPI0030141E83